MTALDARSAADGNTFHEVIASFRESLPRRQFYRDIAVATFHVARCWQQ